MLTIPQFSSLAQTSLPNSRLVYTTFCSISSPGCLTHISSYMNLPATPHSFHLLECLSDRKSNYPGLLPHSSYLYDNPMVLPSTYIHYQTTSTVTPSHSHLSLTVTARVSELVSQLLCLLLAAHSQHSRMQE